METIICKKCNCSDYKTEKKSNNLVATCNKCNCFIKNVPQGEATLYFGKYKDSKISKMTSVEETKYLHWLINSKIKLSENIKKAIKKVLNL